MMKLREALTPKAILRPLSEDFLHPIQQPFLDGLVIVLKGLIQPAHDFLLFLGELGRHDDIGSHVKISPRRPTSLRDSTIPHTENGTGLCTGRNPQAFLLPFQRRNGNIGAESRLWEGDGNVTVEVVLTPLEELVLLDGKHDIQVAGRTPLTGGFTLAADPQLVSRIHTGRDLHFESAFFDNASLPTAGLAGIFDNLTCTTALRAGSSDAEEPLLKANLSIAVAGATGRRTASLH